MQLPSAPTFITVKDTYAYLTLGDAGMAIIDIHQPAQAVPAQSSAVGGNQPLSSCSPTDSSFYVSSSQAVYVVDISQPAYPRLLGSTSLNAGYAQFYGSLLLVDTERGFALVDASIPTAPIIVGVYEDDWTLGILAINGNFVYMKSFGCGMHGCDYSVDVIDISDPSNPVFATWLDTWSIPASIFFQWGNRLRI